MVFHLIAHERRGDGYHYIGENIWWSSEDELRSDLESVLMDFYSEKAFYDYDSRWCLPGMQCGHYTQVSVLNF